MVSTPLLQLLKQLHGRFSEMNGDEKLNPPEGFFGGLQRLGLVRLVT
jgi:hypothetical protein